MLAVWQEADEIDVYESGWTFDHFYPIFSDSSGPCLEGWTTLTALAQATNRLRVGVLVTGIHYRHPAVLANMAAPSTSSRTAGWSSVSARAGTRRNPAPTGSSWARPGNASTASRRPARCSSSLFRKETTTYHGKYYPFKDARNEPKGPQTPHPPICIGGSGEKRTLPPPRRYAQHWNYGGTDPEEFAHKRDVLARPLPGHRARP